MKPQQFHRLSTSLLLLFALFLTAASLHAKDNSLKRRVVALPTDQSDVFDAESDKIVFKIREGLGQPVLNQGRFDRTGTAWNSLNALLASSDRAAGVSPRFQMDKSALDRMRQEGSRRAGISLPDLTLYYEIDIPASASPQERLALLKQIRGLDIVEVAYFAPRPEVASIEVTSSLTPAWESGQYYLQAAPTGIDAYYGWGLPGGHGENVKVIDIEGNWIQTHEDLHGGTDDFHIAGALIDDPGWWNHGTAVLGEIASDSNDFGMTGIAYNVDLGTVSIGSMTTANAITTATANCVEGDIILIELHAPGPHYDFQVRSDQRGYVAMEYWQENFDAILTASALGRIVVEAGGNGAENYDDTSIYDSLFYPDYRFSGAIMVAASDENHVPASFTNYGIRLDVHAFGTWNVFTLGYGDLYGTTPDDYYTAEFAGTSSASPIIVGACAVLQGINKAAHTTTLDHNGMRALLTSYSTPQALSSKNIGPLPDLRGSSDAVFGVSFTSSVTSGWAPLGVDFFGSSGLAVDSWSWNFGDGGTAAVQNPAHTYNTAGIFDVTLEVMSGGEPHTMTKLDYMIVLADTMKAGTDGAAPGEQVEIVITANNTVPVHYFKIPVEFPGDLAVTFDSFSTVGCRTEYFEQQDYLHYDVWFGKRFTLRLIASNVGTSPDLAPGTGDILKLYWTIPAAAVEGQTATVRLGGYEAYLPEYQSDILDYTVPTESGEISVVLTCCQLRGDIDHNGVLDPLDVTYFVNWMWKGGPDVPCPEECDNNGDGEIDPLDLTYLVNYIWKAGPAPEVCP
ncbi:MAG: S8 family serine peptidase [Candidatus Zixiibacteriota bacterium]